MSRRCLKYPVGRHAYQTLTFGSPLDQLPISSGYGTNAMVYDNTLLVFSLIGAREASPHYPQFLFDILAERTYQRDWL